MIGSVWVGLCVSDNYSGWNFELLIGSVWVCLCVSDSNSGWNFV